MRYFAIIVAIAVLAIPFHGNTKEGDDWLIHARITTPYGYNTTWEEGLARAVKNGANVILDWAEFSDTYQGRILHFHESLQQFRQRVEYVHSHYPSIKYMVYFAPLEMQTYDSDMNMDGKDDDGKESTYTDHPEWLQVGIDGRKAVFYGCMPGMPFWVGEHDEDVWLSPSNMDYKKIILNEAKEIASAGVDAIWFDVPHLCFDFGDAWQNQWSSVDNASRAAFHNDTGLMLPAPPIQPDWSDEAWLKFVEWRYEQILDFVRDFYNAMKAANPDCKLIIETSSDGSVHTTQVASDIVRMPYVCDAIAHEYTGPFHEIQYYAWLNMLATLKQWHDFDLQAGKNASWLLSYVKEGKVDLARFHASLVITMGFNYYTSGNIGMAGIVDEQFMHDFFEWLSSHDSYFYGWNNDASVAVVYSRYTLDYLDRGSWEGYAYHDGIKGILMMLLESNIPFEVITENDLHNLSKYKLVILPDFACMDENDAEKIKEYVANGGKIIAINETSLYTKYGAKRNNFLLKDVFGVDLNNAEEGKIYENIYGEGKAIFTITPIARYYYWAAQPWSSISYQKEAEKLRANFLKMIEKANASLPFSIKGNAIVIPYEKGSQKMFRILNFDGIRYGNAVPSPQNVKIKIKGNVSNVKLLDFMGEWRNIDVEKNENESIISFTLYTQATLLYSLNESKLYVTITKPREGILYFMDREIMPIASDKAVIIGRITVEAETNGNKVEFYVNDELRYEDDTSPYQWTWNETAMGKHEIKVVAYGRGKAEDRLDIMIFNL
ncbi:MAG: beta-galactosidase trimerization domain-containing protein [Thermoplasmata archaeon]|nr:beta-galactosidase trimerization domain-containing protein [Thermoplasmata archaeon]